LANDSTTNKKSVGVAPGPVVAEPIYGAEPLGAQGGIPAVRLDPEQFEQFRRTVVFAAAVFGTLASGRQPTPNQLAGLEAYAKVVLELTK
jgi:hypothetical protein